MGQYTKKGLYSAYDKNNKERQKEDYYATPPQEVENILDICELHFNKDDVILEPCIGGGHMLEGIKSHLNKVNEFPKIIGTDIKERDYPFKAPYNNKIILKTGNKYDYMLDTYEFDEADYIIMNPPFKLIEPFCIRSFDIAKKGILCFARLQFLEGKGRYDNIFKNTPPFDVYVYIDRIACYKDGDFTRTGSSAQAYAWFKWDFTTPYENTKIHWIKRKKG